MSAAKLLRGDLSHLFPVGFSMGVDKAKEIQLWPFIGD